MSKPIKTLGVVPRIPAALKDIKKLIHNMWYSWNYDASDLFMRIHPQLWEESRGNPVAFLGRLPQEELMNLCGDEGFLAHMERVRQEFERYMTAKPDPKVCGEREQQFLIAYFTAECGVAESLPIYSGGLGILSGDHLKSASDLNLPVVGISLAYQKGYFRQYLSQDGWQMETYPVNEFALMPMRRVRDKDGREITVIVNLKGQDVWVGAWCVDVGRTRLFLLDTNLTENPEWARHITSELYGGNNEMRVCQEIILGMGGVRFLKAMGLEPAVYHMNEGHSAFAAFERVRALREENGFTFNEALDLIRATNVFTTHTPIDAGIDRFHPDLMRAYFEGLAKSMGISFDVFLGFGRQDPRNKGEEFCMAVLALRLSTFSNAVSRLHGTVSRRMWQSLWPHTPEIDLPIVHITNGIHVPSWISRGMADNYNRYLGPSWIEDPDNVKVWEGVNRIPDTELWRTHERARDRLVAFSRKRLADQLKRRGASDMDQGEAMEVLNSGSLTICFARRFAPYKRAHLILKDVKRLLRILTDKKRPVQIIFAGKAHPQDHMGKETIKEVTHIANREEFRRHLVFLEDYDMELSQYMVQGADIWLNTPRRPLEACGTSGMKAVANGALHLSVLDGWWDEGYEPGIGWAIGGGEEYQDHAYQDELESKVLYDILEKDVAPLFYERGPEGLPRRWLAMMKSSLFKLCPKFNTHRMLEEYWERFYKPAAKRGAELLENQAEKLKILAEWREKIMYNWSKVEVRDIRMDDMTELEVSSPFHVETDVFFGDLLPEDVVVEAYYGRLDPNDAYKDSFTVHMETENTDKEGVYTFRCDVLFAETGRFGINVRLTPNHPDPESRHAMGLVKWGNT